jgi:hypothetical protein
MPHPSASAVLAGPAGTAGPANGITNGAGRGAGAALFCRYRRTRHVRRRAMSVPGGTAIAGQGADGRSGAQAGNVTGGALPGGPRVTEAIPPWLSQRLLAFPA